MMKRKLIMILAVALVSQLSFGGLVGHWALDDGSGSTAVSAVNSPADDGTLAGGAAFVSGAVEFDGVDSWIETPVLGIAGAGARTVAAWIKIEEGNYGDAIVTWGDSWVKEGGSYTQLGYRFTFKINNQSGELRAEIGGGYANGTSIVTDGQWHHIAVTTAEGDGDMANVLFYIDGQLDPVSAFGNANPINSEAAEIGIGGVITPSTPDGNASFWLNGLLADVRIYDEQLSREDIASIVPEPISMLFMAVGGIALIHRKRNG